jgi:DNA-binding ferritin-like protein (Dps family)
VAIKVNRHPQKPNYIIQGEKSMNFWELITGSDMTKEMKTFESRAKKLPNNYQAAWEKINANLWTRSDFTGRNLMPILDGVLGLLEEAAADGQSVQEVLGDDIKDFCSALASEEGAKSFRDKWREQLNNNIAKKLGKE